MEYMKSDWYSKNFAAATSMQDATCMKFEMVSPFYEAFVILALKNEFKLSVKVLSNQFQNYSRWLPI